MVLKNHAAVLQDPEPSVLVEELGASSVILRAFFWVDIHEHSGVKVRSSVIRMMKLAVEEAGLTMPDDAREVIFPNGVPVVTDGESRERDDLAKRSKRMPSKEDGDHSNEAEGDLKSDADDIRKQAATSESLNLGPDLVSHDSKLERHARNSSEALSPHEEPRNSGETK